MYKNISGIVILINMALVGCAIASNQISPDIAIEEFPGFKINQKHISTNPTLSDYQYQSSKGGAIDIHSCKQAKALDISIIAEYEYFRFQQLLVSCEAVAKYARARPSAISNFPARFDKKFFARLPATVEPLLSKADLAQRAGKTFIQYSRNTMISLENANTAKLMTPEDEIYITVLARGDFNNDGVEDLLIKSEWYARNANGKHIDLLILSKNAKNTPTHIEWRLQSIK